MDAPSQQHQPKLLEESHTLTATLWTQLADRIRSNIVKLSVALILTAVVLSVVVGLSLHILAPDWRWESVPFHSTIESVGSLAALWLAIFAMMFFKNRLGFAHYVWIAAGLIGMGILSGFHASVLPGAGFVWLHSVSNLVGGFLFALVWLPDRVARSRWSNTLPGAIAIASLIFSAHSVAFREVWPAMTSQGEFTLAAKAINVLGGVFFLAAAIPLIIRYQAHKNLDDLVFVNLCLLFGSAGLLFPLSQLWLADWWFWHLLRLIAYLIALGYVLAIFQRGDAELRMTNAALQSEIAERKKIEEEIRQRNRELTVLYTIRRDIAQSLDLRQVLDDAVKVTLDTLGIEGGAIVLSDPDGQTLNMRAHRGLSEEFVRNTEHIKIGEGITGKAIAEKTPVVLNVSEYPTARLAPFIVKEGLQTLASTPLLSAGEVLGAMSLGTRRVRAFPPEELELLKGIGELLGGAVQNAQLYQQVQQELAERKRAEEELRETRDYLDNLLGYANAPIIVWSPDMRITRFNAAFERLTGYAAAEVIGKELAMLFPEASRNESLDKISRALGGEYWETVEIPILRKDGNIRIALWNSANIHAADDVTVLVACLISNLT